MCWNATISLSFTIAMILLRMWLKHIDYEYLDRATVGLFIYGFMQFSQFLNWITILPLSQYGHCTPSNHWFTYVAFIALAIQPFGNNLSVMLGESLSKRPKFKLPLIFSAIYALVLIMQFVIGDRKHMVNSEKNPINQEYIDSILAEPYEKYFSTTIDELFGACTYARDYIVWRFPLIQDSNLFQFSTFHLLSLSIFETSNWRQFAIMFICYYVLAFISVYEYPDSAESAAFWCKSTIVYCILYFLDGLYFLKTRHHTNRTN